MRLLKTFGLAALMALLAMAFVGAGSAMAESTSLCNLDPGTGQHEACPSGQLATHVHETTLSGQKAKLLFSSLTIECDVLFSGDVGELGAPLVISGEFTYTNCSNSCTVTEDNGPATLNILKLGHEAADATLKFLVHAVCTFFDCEYYGEGMKGSAKGPLLASEANGEIKFFEQILHKDGGFLCPKEGKLDIVTTPLSATYITE